MFVNPYLQDLANILYYIQSSPEIFFVGMYSHNYIMAMLDKQTL